MGWDGVVSVLGLESGPNQANTSARAFGFGFGFGGQMERLTPLPSLVRWLALTLTPRTRRSVTAWDLASF